MSRLPYLYEGEVTRRDDPDGLGRVKILIPGIIEPETPNWAWPMGSPGGGSAQRGTFEPPAVGSTVMVWFKMGERDYPYYLTGPWGEPGGVSDVPTNAEVEASDRQNAVTEDEEWRVERDSRSSGKKYLIRHKNSSLAVLLDADADKVHLVRETASQAIVRGTAYRAAETAHLTAIINQLSVVGATFLLFKADVAFVAAFAALAGLLETAGNTLNAAASSLSGQDMAATPTAYLSTKGFTD